MLETVSVTATVCIELDELRVFNDWVREVCERGDHKISVSNVIDFNDINYALTCTLRDLVIPGGAIRTHSDLEERTKCNL